jgi:RND family efflux transporter MFP subunit
MGKSSRMGKIKLLLFPLVIGLSLLVMNSRLKHIEDEPVMTQAPWALAMAIVKEGSVSSGFPALGMVQSASEVRITPQISGAILKLGPRAGGHVAKGDLLVLLDTRELEASRDSLQSKLASTTAIAENNSKELEREQKLFKEGGSAASAVELWLTKVRADKANVRSIEKQIRQIEVKIAYGHIHSPIDAGISGRFAEIGDTAMPGKTLYVLTSQQGGRVIVPVPLATITRIKPGDEVQLNQGSESMIVQITRINPILDKLAMGSVEIDLPRRPFGLPGGARVSARVISDKLTQAILVSQHALVPAADMTKRALFKVEKKKDGYILHKIMVNVPLCGPQACAVEGDIQVGDNVVIGHSSTLLKLRDGDSVIDVSQVGSR